MIIFIIYFVVLAFIYLVYNYIITFEITQKIFQHHIFDLQCHVHALQQLYCDSCVYKFCHTLLIKERAILSTCWGDWRHGVQDLKLIIVTYYVGADLQWVKDSSGLKHLMWAWDLAEAKNLAAVILPLKITLTPFNKTVSFVKKGDTKKIQKNKIKYMWKWYKKYLTPKYAGYVLTPNEAMYYRKAARYAKTKIGRHEYSVRNDTYHFGGLNYH